MSLVKHDKANIYTVGMGIFVDNCVWMHREYMWCHMVSDSSLDELHEFARDLGVPPRGFHGDHYDLPAHVREIALERGAQAVTSRELVALLTSAGLRLSAASRRDYRLMAELGQGSEMFSNERGQ